MIRDIEKILKAPIERKKIDGFDYTVQAPVDERVRPQNKTNGRNFRPSRRSPGRELPGNMLNKRRPSAVKVA
jgi:hypothetical protein